MDWDCPSWGCHGRLSTEGQPRSGQLIWCERWPGTESAHCGRRMRWDAARQVWRPVRAVEPPRRADFGPAFRSRPEAPTSWLAAGARRPDGGFGHGGQG